MVYVHPVLGLITLALLVWLGIAGFRARHPAPYARAARGLHRRFGVIVAGLFGLTAALGLLSTALLRDDLSPAASGHALAAGLGVLLMVTLYVLSRRMPGDARARRVHPWVGLVSLLVAAAIFWMGFELLPG